MVRIRAAGAPFIVAAGGPFLLDSGVRAGIEKPVESFAFAEPFDVLGLPTVHPEAVFLQEPLPAVHGRGLRSQWGKFVPEGPIRTAGVAEVRA